MSAEAAVNAVYKRKIDAMADPAERDRFVADRRREYECRSRPPAAGVRLHVDAVVENEALRGELIRRLDASEGWSPADASPTSPIVPV